MFIAIPYIHNIQMNSVCTLYENMLILKKVCVSCFALCVCVCVCNFLWGDPFVVPHAIPTIKHGRYAWGMPKGRRKPEQKN